MLLLQLEKTHKDNLHQLLQKALNANTHRPITLEYASMQNCTVSATEFLDTFATN